MGDGKRSATQGMRQRSEAALCDWRDLLVAVFPEAEGLELEGLEAAASGVLSLDSGCVACSSGRVSIRGLDAGLNTRQRRAT